jgi:hypothetical protein
MSQLDLEREVSRVDSAVMSPLIDSNSMEAYRKHKISNLTSISIEDRRRVKSSLETGWLEIWNTAMDASELVNNILWSAREDNILWIGRSLQLSWEDLPRHILIGRPKSAC